MIRHYELTAEQFAFIEDLLPANGKPGGQWNDHLTALNGILWILHTGAQWRELPERYGKWKSVHDRLSRWRADGTFVSNRSMVAWDLSTTSTCSRPACPSTRSTHSVPPSDRSEGG